MNPSPQSRPIVSAIIEKVENNVRSVFLQTRWKPKVSPTYTGLLEIPAGGIEGYEDVINALKREVKEETGLVILRIIGNFSETSEENIAGNRVKVFRPFLCQQMLSSTGGLPWVGFIFRCEVQGNVTINKDEAKDPKWVTVQQLRDLLSTSPSLFFPLQYPVLKYYVENVDSENLSKS